MALAFSSPLPLQSFFHSILLTRQTLSARPNRQLRPTSPRRSPLICCASNEASGEQPSPVPNDSNTPQSDEELEAELQRRLAANSIKWADIPFRNIEHELALIEQYEREEEIEEGDPWPRFLRGAAYESWGQPQLALAQYAKTNDASGLRRVPEIWERRGYNSFKVGKVAAANTYFEIALTMYYESTGNQLHFTHWFYDNFKDHLPKWNGPPAPLQRAICQYCVGNVKDARSSLVPQIELMANDFQHSLLWFLAAAARHGPDGVMKAPDARVAFEALGKKYDWTPRLKMFLNLYHAAALGIYGDVSVAEQEVSDAIKTDEKDDVISHVYMALYHDAFTKDATERDRALDTVTALGGTASPRDTENFLFHAAKNRLTFSKKDSDSEVPEKAPY